MYQQKEGERGKSSKTKEQLVGLLRKELDSHG
jgi:hypothetical protein